MNEKNGFFKKLFKKSFFIELDEALTYPSAQTICQEIEKYAAGSKEELRFESKVKPVTFYLDDKLYRAEISMARGGYYISCNEV
ncbi:DUF4318 domain-containing protein [Bacillus sp. 22475]|uniref:DUF4318 domain-containing protein n=1 Tax=Bacillus thuringiensis TaxID=1428 RepID=A0A9X6ZS39_BACTU|nr:MULTISPECIES: DUF4318 domain-containing protein [Bacillus]OWT47264.1 hypothetical protein CER22_32200 [Bacillus sp. K2I17]PFJ36908.1 DUF4318 domain-containing protein [Bacillus thuringiensis]PFN51945.1 DUF4318 domain-containing protein [Bacillus thuringiensis]